MTLLLKALWSKIIDNFLKMDQSEQTTLNPLNDANTVGRSGNPAAPDLYSCPNCEMQFKSHFLMRRHLDQLCVGTGPTVVVPRSPTTPENFKQDLSQRKQVKAKFVKFIHLRYFFKYIPTL